ncbi:hypothetical protein AB0O42_27880 [Streptomyces sp. NPDC089922]|uniref:hypothetical protein n=1 Tax=Streptomyces sp. NPDC089922 TaxID=3155189 RepID=UPI003449C19C
MNKTFTVAALTGMALLSAATPALADGGTNQGSTFANERSFADFFGLDSKDSTQKDVNINKPDNVLDNLVADLVNQPSQ